MENKPEEKASACIPFFAHENIVVHYNHANRRMLVALLAVCITFILTIVIFVHGYTVREKNWLDTLSRITPTTAEVTDGVHE
ncbi:MAG: hypothetical protein J6S60_04780 [Oscillospiraceae bacterium]|nr:hypothetical protein [Oscillospiraceae bacterium]